MCDDFMLFWCIFWSEIALTTAYKSTFSLSLLGLKRKFISMEKEFIDLIILLFDLKNCRFLAWQHEFFLSTYVFYAILSLRQNISCSVVASNLHEMDDEVPTTVAVAFTTNNSQSLSRRTRLKGDNQFGAHGLADGSHRSVSVDGGWVLTILI